MVPENQEIRRLLYRLDLRTDLVVHAGVLDLVQVGAVKQVIQRLIQA